MSSFLKFGRETFHIFLNNILTHGILSSIITIANAEKPKNLVFLLFSDENETFRSKRRKNAESIIGN